VDECRHAVHAKSSRCMKKQCMKIIKRLAEDRSKVDKQEHGKKLDVDNWKLL